jgi:hypothetical protein
MGYPVEIEVVTMKANRQQGKVKEGTDMESGRIWAEQCEAARGIEDEFGTRKAMDYLIGEKFLNFLEVAETHPEFKEEIPAFVAEIKTIFEPWQLAEYLEKTRQSEPFDAGIYDDEDPEVVEEERRADISRCASDLLLVEQAREWLLGDGSID